MKLLHPPLYIYIHLSHAQKGLPQTVTVPQPSLRYPWRFLPRQVGNPEPPPPSFTHPQNAMHLCTSRSHHTFLVLPCRVPSRFVFNPLWQAWNCALSFALDDHTKSFRRNQRTQWRCTNVPALHLPWHVALLVTETTAFYCNAYTESSIGGIKKKEFGKDG